MSVEWPLSYFKYLVVQDFVLLKYLLLFLKSLAYLSSNPVLSQFVHNIQLSTVLFFNFILGLFIFYLVYLLFVTS